jgi:hypothetical protein
LCGTTDYSARLEAQARGLIDSWAIRWYWSVFRANGLVLYPPRTYVINKGMDGTGTHSSLFSRLYLGRQSAYSDWPIDMPSEIALDEPLFEEVKRFLVRLKGPAPIRLLRQLRHAIRTRKARPTVGNAHK